MAEVVQIHRLSDEKSCCLEGVTDLQFGVFGFNDCKTSIAFVTKDTTSVGQPCHFDAIAFLQVICRNAFALKGCTLYVGARVQFCQIRLPVCKTEELSKQAEGSATRCICAVDIPPEAFEGGR